MIRFKLEQMAMSFGHYVETGDFEHLGDIARILVWDGTSGEVKL